jgi:ABC-2 type transport system permease protein
VNARITLATARRVLNQLRRDPRTVALLFVVPAVLLSLLRWMLTNQRANFDHIGAPVLAIFPFVAMFVVTSVATLRERTTGTLERLLTMPIHKLDLLLGYAIAFGAVAVVQVGISASLALGPLGLRVAGAGWLLFVVGVLDAKTLERARDVPAIGVAPEASDDTLLWYTVVPNGRTVTLFRPRP